MAEVKQVKRIVCQVYSRVAGYLSPVQNWNKGKQKEWEDRKPYRMDKAVKP